MKAADQKNKNSAMSAHLKLIGYPHGRTMSTRRNDVPSMGDVGSAAYRRLHCKDGR